MLSIYFYRIILNFIAIDAIQLFRGTLKILRYERRSKLRRKNPLCIQPQRSLLAAFVSGACKQRAAALLIYLRARARATGIN
jgi:hypothetical protein